MDSIAIRGVQLESDDRMLAASERYYAPVIRGVANTNAIVSVRQNGNLLREVSVPAELSPLMTYSQPVMVVILKWKC